MILENVHIPRPVTFRSIRLVKKYFEKRKRKYTTTFGYPSILIFITYVCAKNTCVSKLSLMRACPEVLTKKLHMKKTIIKTLRSKNVFVTQYFLFRCLNLYLHIASLSSVRLLGLCLELRFFFSLQTNYQN